MTLRPRYSLLSLLVLTALVAGGVKLWYGPHRVVEPHPGFAFLEWEYTYTRDWRGERVIDGPIVFRQMERSMVSFWVQYSRQGVDTKWMYLCCFIRPSYVPYILEDATCPLSNLERQAFDEACDAELKKHAATGRRPEVIIEGLHPRSAVIPYPYPATRP